MASGEVDKISSLTDDVGKLGTDGAMLIAYLFVPLVLMILLGPFIMCFCCCDNKCPLNCCCRKDGNFGCCDTYTCPILAIIFILATLAASTAGVIYSFDMADSIAQL